MIDEVLREVKEKVFLPVAKKLSSAGITPTKLTLVGFVFGVVSAICFGLGSWWLGVACWWLNRLLDGLDGVVARHANQQTDFGGYLDIICDFCIYAWVPLGLTLYYDYSTFCLFAAAFMQSSYFVNAASLFYAASILEKRAAIPSKKLTSIVMPPALIEGTETLIFYQLFMLFPTWLPHLFFVFGSAVYFNVLQRLFWALKAFS